MIFFFFLIATENPDPSHRFDEVMESCDTAHPSNLVVYDGSWEEIRRLNKQTNKQKKMGNK